MATIQERARGVVASAPATFAAMCDSVSPGRTIRVEPAAALALSLPALREGAAVRAAGAGSAGEDEGAAGSLRAIAPSRVPEPTAGAATGAAATCDCGAYTGGSSSTVNSRTR